MRPQFNEREFETAFSAEFLGLHGAFLAGLHIPSTTEEAQCGYDARFDLEQKGSIASLFLQHKVSNYISRPRGVSKVMATNHRWHPFFYFPLRRLDRSRQHNLLVELQSQGEEVYYTAPDFWKKKMLLESMQERRILDRTSFFSPGDIGHISDLRQHYVSYDTVSPLVAFFYSEPHQLKAPLKWENVLKPLHRQKYYDGYWDDLLERLTKVCINVLQAPPPYPKFMKEWSMFWKIGYILRTYFGVEWYIL